MATSAQKLKAQKQLEKAQQQLDKIKKSEQEQEHLKNIREADELNNQALKRLPEFMKWFGKDLGTDRRKNDKGQYENIQITPLMAAVEVIQIENYLKSFSWIKSVIIGWYASNEEFDDFAVYLEVNPNYKISIKEHTYFDMCVNSRSFRHSPFPWNVLGSPDEISIEDVEGKSYIRIWWD